MSAIAVSWFERTISTQLIALLSIGTLIILIMCIIATMKNVPSILIAALILSSLFVMIVSSINVTCMVVGDCHVWSWITTMFTLITILLIFSNVLRR